MPEQRLVVFVHQDHDAAIAGGERIDQLKEAIREMCLLQGNAKRNGVPVERVDEFSCQFLRRLCRRAAHVQVNHRVRLPFVIGAGDGKALEQAPPTLENSLERADQQRLAEPARPSQEVLGECGLQQRMDFRRLVDVKEAALNELAECIHTRGNRFHRSHCTVTVTAAQVQTQI